MKAAGCSSSVSPKKEELSNDLMVFSRSSAVEVGEKKEGRPALENGRTRERLFLIILFLSIDLREVPGRGPPPPFQGDTRALKGEVS